MQKAEELMVSIEKLPENEFIKLKNWILNKDWNRWDDQIKKDSAEGKLDFLSKEVSEEKEQLSDL